MPLGLQGRSAPLFLQAVRTSSYTRPPTLPSPLAGRPRCCQAPEAPQALSLLARPSLCWAQHPEPLPLLSS